MTVSVLESHLQKTREPLENYLKTFFECGITPDFADKPEDAEVLKGTFELFY